jgi:hypothetical protein
MWHGLRPAVEFLKALEASDAETVERVRSGGCAHCDGPLYRSDYWRKPRGGLLVPIVEPLWLRFSLCCGREGCRKRTTPPSIRFLGRRVYLEVAVLLAGVIALAVRRARQLREQTGIPARTIERWGSWWRTTFTKTAPFIEANARAVGVLVVERLPESLLALFEGTTPSSILMKTMRWLSPLTTSSCPCGGAALTREG